MSWSNFCFLTYLAPICVGGNAVMTDCSKSCGRLREVTMPIGTVSLEGRAPKFK